MKKVNNVVKYGNYAIGNISLKLSGLDPALQNAINNN